MTSTTPSTPALDEPTTNKLTRMSALHVLDTDGASCCNMAPDGRVVVGYGQTGIFNVWKDGVKVLEVDTGGYVHDVVFSARGDYILASLFYANAAVIYDAFSGEEVQRLSEGHTEAVRKASWSPDSELVATASNDNAVRLFDSQTGVCLQTTSTNGVANHATFSSDGKLLVASDANGCVQVLQRDEGVASPSYSLLCKTDGSTGVNYSAVSPLTNSLIACGKSGTVDVFKMQREEAGTAKLELVTTLTGLPGSCYEVIWDSSEQHVIAVSTQGIVAVWRVSDSEPVYRHDVMNVTGALYGVSMSRSGTHLSVVGANATIVFRAASELSSRDGLTAFLFATKCEESDVYKHLVQSDIYEPWVLRLVAESLLGAEFVRASDE